MSGIKYLLDSCFILELSKRNPEVLTVIREKSIHLSECAISTINRMEVLGYKEITSEESHHLSILLSKMLKIPISDLTENRVIELRKTHKIKLPDCIVLATALNNHLELLTLDTGLKNKFLMETGII